MERNSAHDTLLNNLNLTPVTGETFGLKRKPFATSFDPNSGLGLAIASMLNLNESILHHLIDNNETEAQKVFPDEVFETPSIAIFSSGWPGNSDYSTWAKFEELDLLNLTLPLGIKKPKINREFRTNERDTRAQLVNNLTGLRSLELHTNDLEESTKKSSGNAIAKIFLSNIRFFAINWMSAKMKLRKQLLNNQDTDGTRILLKSNMWDASIFPKEAFEEVKKLKSNDSIRSRLNMDKEGGVFKKPYDFQRSKDSSGRWPQKNSQNNAKPYDRFSKKGSFDNSPSNRDFGSKKPYTPFLTSEGDKDTPSTSASQGQSSNRNFNQSQRGKFAKKKFFKRK